MKIFRILVCSFAVMLAPTSWTVAAWFDEYSTFLTNPQLTAIESVSPTAIRESGYWGGWYGRFVDSEGIGWMLNYQEPQK